jgi:hypothetical protein
VNTNSSPSNQEEEASSREAGGWKSVKYIIGIYVTFQLYILMLFCYKHDWYIFIKCFVFCFY